MSEGKLPEGWVPCKLGDTLLKIVGGGTPSKAIPEYYRGDIPWMSVKDMNKHTLIDTVDHITPDAVKNSSTNIIPAGIPIIATRMSLGKVVTASFDSAINQDLKALFLANGIERNFFLHWYRAQAQLIESLGTGTTVKGIRLEVLDSLAMDLPPLAEQKIIAEKLDTLVEQVDSTKARLEQIPKILKRFRQAVLAAAMNGKLTEEWRSLNLNVPKFSENFDNIKYFRNAELPKIPKIWQWLRFDQIAEIASNLKSPLHFPNTTHIAPNHIESWTGKVFGYQTISEDGVTSAKHEFYKGQIIYSKIRPYLCKVAIASFDGLCSADMYPINSKIDTYFLFRWMLTTTFTDWVSNAESRTVLPKINQKGLSEIPVPVPPLSEQHEIVRRVEQLFSYADTIEKQVNNALARVNNLTQSILAKAFRGELTAQWRAENPELISGENSAAALLEKIKAQRAASTGKKATR
ncbi:restriction endonuclease subunit S [Pantoea dispersa]|uniref:restriction endonuclease subunit S n=1 Tax=Pantoea dispersa TaxID=59814 RepID=UPI0024AF9D70|nr:restriction endonuclease subunit S [Pantoea dispersa]MDI6635369.1 restriction endonuclease subunit S [Pantoea dispersa]